MLYHFYLGDVMVRLDINSTIDGAQLIRIGFFNYSKVENSVTLTQFNPLNDLRFQNMEPIVKLWSQDYNSSWGYLRHFADEGETALANIIEILNIINRVNKLKAFL